jgi:papain fold toxin 1 (glutamine deamidase) of polymorphic toxin system
MRRALRVTCVVALLAGAPATAFASDCPPGSWTDCYGTMIAAAIVIAAIAVFAAFMLPELLTVAAAEGALELEGAAVADAIGEGMAADVLGTEAAGEVGGAAAGDEAAALADEEFVDVAEGSETIPDQIFEKCPGLGDVNPGGFADNCPECSVLADGILGGGPPAQATDSGIATVESLEDKFGSYFADSSFQRTEEELLASGDGSRGIVFIQGGATEGEGVGHFFNVVNDGGEIRWVDTQTRTAYNTAEVVYQWGSRWLEFMPTFP